MQHAAPIVARTPFWSVRMRILAVIMVLTVLFLAIGGVSMFFLLRERILASVDERLTFVVASAEFIVRDTDSDGAPDNDVDIQQLEPAREYRTNAHLIQHVMRGLVLHGNESSVGLVNDEVRFTPASVRPFAIEQDPEFIQRVIDETADREIVMGTAVTSVGTVRYVGVPMHVRGTDGGALYISAIDLDAELEPLETFQTYTLIAIGAVLITGLVGWVVAGRLLRPVRELRQTASRITISDLSERIPVGGRDDVSQLTETMNEMLDRLEQSVTAQQHLLDDVRHELGTPITIVRGHLELMDASDADDVRATRGLALDEIDRMERLLADIQVLAGSGRPIVEPEAVDIERLTRQVYEKASALPGHTWTLAEVATGMRAADPQRITQAWLQLADNAAKYSPDGSPIELGSRVRDDGRLELWVADRGPGIPEESQARIFERFGRVDAGRGVRGSGLGLPIVAAIATAHGGRVDLASAVGVGSRFAIVIPGALHEPSHTPPPPPPRPTAPPPMELKETRA